MGPNTAGYILTRIDEIQHRRDPHSSYSLARGARLLGKRGQLGKEPSDHVIKWASPFLQTEPYEPRPVFVVFVCFELNCE